MAETRFRVIWRQNGLLDAQICANMPRGDNMKISMSEESCRISERKGPFAVLEYQKDSSVNPSNADTEYFMAQMGVRKKQLMFTLNGNSVTLQAGAMQWSAGDIAMSSGIKGAGGLLKGLARAAAAKESVSQPVYSGNGNVVCEPTYKFFLIEDLKNWNGGIVMEDGMFYAHDDRCTSKLVSRKHFSAMMAGNESLINMSVIGDGYVVMESNVPRDELVCVELEEGDTLRIDGTFAICWSTGLDFTVERSSSSLIGSAVSGEGLVNVYRGTGRVLIAPVTRSDSYSSATRDTRANVKNPEGTPNFSDIMSGMTSLK